MSIYTSAHTVKRITRDKITRSEKVYLSALNIETEDGSTFRVELYAPTAEALHVMQEELGVWHPVATPRQIDEVTR